MDFTNYMVNGYDDMYDIGVYTELFTKLDGIELIDEKHPFIHFLKGFIHDEFECEIIHGWYHVDSKIMKCIPNQHPSNVGNIIHTAWQQYWKNNNYDFDVYIYGKYCGELYKSNEYETDKNQFYKDLITRIINKIN